MTLSAAMIVSTLTTMPGVCGPCSVGVGSVGVGLGEALLGWGMAQRTQASDGHTKNDLRRRFAASCTGRSCLSVLSRYSLGQ